MSDPDNTLIVRRLREIQNRTLITRVRGAIGGIDRRVASREGEPLDTGDTRDRIMTPDQRIALYEAQSRAFVSIRRRS